MTRRLIALCALALVLPLPAVHAQAPAAAERLILDPSPGTIFTIEGHYPQERGTCEFKQRKPIRVKYRGRLDVARAADGTLRLINILPFETYLYGLAEVPPSWPEAALRAQVIAARSYALDAIKRGTAALHEKGADICSTDACQVYRGALVELGAFGDRWVHAVDATRERVLTYEGRVVQAFYFSTSDGRTRRSFPGGTPQPVYPAVEGEDDDAPLARWIARIRLADLTAVLRSRSEWSGRQITGISQDGDRVRVTDGSAVRSIERSDLRRFLNQEAPCLFPDRYPPEDEAKKLPQTVPSSQYSVARSGGTALLRGRGWGHFVGMSQWGAKSLADRGRSAVQILAHYYGPARVRRMDVPDTIRVLAAEDMTSVRISAEGEFTARTETGSVLRPSARFEVRGGDSLRVLRGRGPSLRPVLTVEPHSTRIDAEPGAEVSVRFTLKRSARVAATLAKGATIVRRVKERSFESGAQEVIIPLSDTQGAALGPGSYEVIVQAYDGLDRVKSVPIAVVIPAPPPPPPASDTPSGGTPPWLIVAGVAGISLAGAALWKLRGQPKVNV